MNALDVIILAIVGYFTVSSVFRGFVQEAFALSGLILGVVAANRYHAYGGELLSAYIADTIITGIVSYVLVFFAVAVIMTLVGRILSRFVKLLFLNWLDRTLGMVLGLTKGLLVACMVTLTAGLVVQQDNDFVKNSRLKPGVESLFFFVPDHFVDRLKAKGVSVKGHLRQGPPSAVSKAISTK